MTEHRKTGISSALTAASRSAATTITISGASGYVYRLKRVEIQTFGTVETVVNTGGRVELENDASDWKPFEVYTNAMTTVGAGLGGGEYKTTIINCNVPLPAGSTTSCYFTPYDDQSQKFAVTLIYEGFFSGKQTFFKSAKGSALTQTTKASEHCTWTIPTTKGGNAISLNVLVLGTIETVVNSGGLIGVRSVGMKPEAIEPFEAYTNSITSVTLGGGVQTLKEIPMHGYILSDQQVIDVDYTPQDNQSQFLAAFIAWEKA